MVAEYDLEKVSRKLERVIEDVVERTAESIPAQDGIHLLLADQPVPFAGRVVRLLRDSELRAALVTQARRLVEEKYDLNVAHLSMQRAMLGLVQGRFTP